MNSKFIFRILLFLAINTNAISLAAGEFSFEQDLAFISQYEQPIVLTADNARAQLVISSKHQGRVLTSTAMGINGHSYGWINYEAIKKDQNGVGGEDRFWLAPIGSQFSLYYPRNKRMVESNWQVPDALINTPAQLVHQTPNSVHFKKHYRVTNHIGTSFNTELNRTINIFSTKQIESELAIQLPNTVNSVGFESINVLTNKGRHWQKDKGLITPWVLGMFKGNNSTIAVFPIKHRDTYTVTKPAAQTIHHATTQSKSPVESYLYPLTEKRLQVNNSHVLFKVDGKYRSKIGIKSDHTLPIMGYYDDKSSTLTVVKFSFEHAELYPDAKETYLITPYNGDVTNSYNHGAMDGSLLPQSSFFELESSAKLAPLKHGQSIHHTHQTYHFTGAKSDLNQLSNTLLGLSISDINTAFNNHSKT